MHASTSHVSVEKIILDNGMKVILAEDHRLPLVTINTWFYVGAKDEPPGRSGFAHLFEHLMFMGTERVPTGQFDRIMEMGGGNNNASTDFDRTNYFSSGPAELLPTLLWLDADRLEDLGRAMTQEKLDLQRDVVRNERRQSIENVPYGKSELKVIEMLYPHGHPYHFDVIGSHSDLQSATLEDVREFFANFYVPNNASLVICGDFNPATIKPMVKDLFGTLPRRPDPARRELAVRALEREERFTTLDQVDAPMVRMAWLAPRAYEAGDADMILLARILGDDKSGRLFRRLVLEEQLASEVEVSQRSYVAASMFTINVRALPGANLDRIEVIIKEELEKIASSGVPSDEIARARAQQELEILGSLEKLLSKADKLNEYEFFFGEPDGYDRDLERFHAVTTESTRRHVAATFGGPGRAVVRVLPQEPERVKTPRDERPKDLEPAAFQPPLPQTFALNNGIVVEAYPSNELPRVEMRVTMLGANTLNGGRIDPSGKEGTTSLFADLLLEGAGDLDGVKFAESLAGVGANLETRAGRGHVDVDLSVPSASLEPVLDRLGDLLTRPQLTQAAFDRVKMLAIESAKQRAVSPNAIVEVVADRAFFGEGHPLARPTQGTLASLQTITLDDVKAVAKSLLDSQRIRIFVAGRVEPMLLKTSLDSRVAALKPGGAAPAQAPIASPVAGSALRFLFVDRPGAVQTTISFTFPGPKRTDNQAVATELLGVVLGGSFTSRLNQNLREDKGYTYGAQCRPRLDLKTGSIIARSSVRADVTGPALSEFLKEFARLKGGDLNDEETSRTRKLYRTRIVERFEGLRERVETLSEMWRTGLSVDSLAVDVQSADAANRESLNELAGSWLPLDRAVLVLVGDASVVMPQLAGLALPKPTVVSPEGDPIRQ